MADLPLAAASDVNQGTKMAAKRKGFTAGRSVLLGLTLSVRTYW